MAQGGFIGLPKNPLRLRDKAQSSLAEAATQWSR
jgi:hypothetical protein